MYEISLRKHMYIHTRVCISVCVTYFVNLNNW